MKLQKKVLVQMNGREFEVDIGDCLGYVPVFETLKEAEAESQGGRFEVVRVGVNEERLN